MTIQDFMVLSRREILKHLGELGQQDIEVSETEVVKANDRLMHGFILRRSNSDTGVNVYVDELFERHESGEKMEEIMAELISRCIYSISCPVPTVLTEGDFEFSRVRDRLTVSLLDTCLNKSFIGSRPYIDAGNGLVLVAYVNSERTTACEWRAPVTDSLAGIIGRDGETILAAALENTMEIEPPSLFNLSDVVLSDYSADLLREPEHLRKDCLCVLTNRARYLGAAVIMYPGIAESICRIVNGGYYAIPSSVHEFIIVPDSMEFERGYLRNLLIHGNAELSDEDVLSYNLYHYDAVTGTLEIA